jgi:hypothetical protein
VPVLCEGTSRMIRTVSDCASQHGKNYLDSRLMSVMAIFRPPSVELSASVHGNEPCDHSPITLRFPPADDVSSRAYATFLQCPLQPLVHLVRLNHNGDIIALMSFEASRRYHSLTCQALNGAINGVILLDFIHLKRVLCLQILWQ